MAAATLNDVTKGLQEVNETLRQQAIAEGKPDPAKFVKEEFAAILAQRSYAKQDRELQTKTAKTVTKQEKKDQVYYKKQLKEQKATTKDLDETNTYLQKLITVTVEGPKAIAQPIIKATTSFYKNLSEGIRSMAKDFDEILGITKGVNKLRSVAGSKDAEDKKKKKFTELRTYKVIRGMAKGISSMAMSLGGLLKDKVKAGATSLFSLLKKFALGGLALAVIAFLNSPKFAEMLKFIRDEVIPVIGEFYEDTLKPLFKNLKEYFFDVIKSFKKFFDDPDLQKAIKDFKEGNFFEGFKGVFTSILKPGGLIDNLSTNLYNLFARIFGFEQIEGKDSLFMVIGKKFLQFYYEFQNMIRSSLNKAFEYIPGFEGEFFDLYDPETGKTIESERNKQQRLKREQQEKRKKEEEERINKFVDQKAKKERQEEAKRIAAMPDRFESGLLNMEKVKARRALLDKEAEALEKAKVAEILSTKKIAKSTGEAARGLFGEKDFTVRIRKQRRILENLERIQAKEGGDRLADKIKQRQQIIRKLRRDQAAIVSNSGNTQQNNVDNSKRFSMAAHPIHHQQPVIAAVSESR